jgi:hypothetical protein
LKSWGMMNSAAKAMRMIGRKRRMSMAAEQYPRASAGVAVPSFG